MGGDMGRSEGATAEKAVPFLCAARRSLTSRSVLQTINNPPKQSARASGLSV
jgi:hypothetical protein